MKKINMVKKTFINALFLSMLSGMACASLSSSYEYPDEGYYGDEAHGTDCAYYHNGDVLFLSGHTVSSNLEHFANKHPQIKVLYLHYCGALEYHDMEDLQFFKQLAYLKVMGASLTDTHVKILSHTELAGRLIAFETEGHFISDSGIEYMAVSGKFKGLRKLALLNVPFRYNITGRSMDALATTELGKNLDRFCMTIEGIREQNLSPSFYSLLLDKCSFYEDLYSKDPMSLEKYLRFEPENSNYLWRFFMDEWSLCPNFQPEVTDTLLQVVDKLLLLQQELGYESGDSLSDSRNTEILWKSDECWTLTSDHILTHP